LAVEKEFVLILAEGTPKLTRSRTTRIVHDRKPIDSDAYYTIREVTDKESPFYVASASTIFRALRSGDLIPNYLGRAVRLKGSAIHAWLRGEGGDTQ
jgi:hypothetical protein